jgi:hypothetical protein
MTPSALLSSTSFERASASAEIETSVLLWRSSTIFLRGAISAEARILASSEMFRPDQF